MNLKRRLDRLEGKGPEPVTVFLTQYDTPSGEPEVARAVIVFGQGQVASLERAAGESEAAFRDRIAAARG